MALLPEMQSGLVRVTENGNRYLNILVRDMAIRRGHQGYTQQELGELIGTADRLVNKWEAGTRVPGLFLAFMWAEALGGQLIFQARDHAAPIKIQSRSHRS